MPEIRILREKRERYTIIIKGADVFFGLSAPGTIDQTDLRNMAADPIVFAMANPTPEIMPEDADGLVAVMATGRRIIQPDQQRALFPGNFSRCLELPCIADQ
jgi:malate dehydrogenase (oxaloacetate-decarboxylating)